MLYFKAMSRRILLLALLCLVAGTACAEIVPGQLLVKFKPKGVAAASVTSLNAKYGVSAVKQLYAEALKIRPDWTQFADDYIVTFPAEKDARQVLQEFKNDPNVAAASVNYRVHAFATTPNDPRFLDGSQWGLSKIDAPQGWDKTTGTNEVIVAVLDTGLNYNHEDFNLAGKVNLADARDFVHGGNYPLDDYGHGTAVSGVIGAVTNNGIGIAGLDWHCKILPLKVLDSSGGGSISTINQALVYIAALKSTGVNVAAANMSFGQYNSSTIDRYSEEDPDNLKEACQAAYAQGIVLVAAAGNGNVNWNTYPAYYPTVLAVAATDSNDHRSIWTGLDPDTGLVQASNYAAWVAVSAPGSNIFSTDMNGSYSAGWNGTSLACPYVAGLASLIKAANPAMSNAQIMNQIETTADNIDALNPSFAGKLGSGRINVYRALAGYLADLTSPANGEYIKGIKAVRGRASGWNFGHYELAALRGGSVAQSIISSTTTVENGVLADWDTVGLDGEYTLRLRVFTNDLLSADATATVIVDNTTPEVGLTAPAPGASVAGLVTLTGTAKDAYLDHYIIEYGAGAAPLTFEAIGTYYASVNSSVLGTWETAGLAGAYQLRLTAYDKAGTMAMTSEVINISPVAPTKEVNPLPGLPLTFALPNPFNRGATAEVSLYYHLPGNFNVVIYLFDLNGSLIWRQNYPAGDNGGKAGNNNPAWDGKSLFGENVANGVYLYQITADQKVIGKGKIIVLN